MLDLDEDNELPPEAFDWRFAPREARQRGLTDTERTRKKRRLALLIADADLYNELLANYGRHVLDRLIEEGITARAFLRAVMFIGEDLDLWLEATGERLVFRNLGPAERRGLECWLWETHDRKRQEWRYKPDRRLNDRPDQEFIAHPSKQLWHGLHDFAGLVGDRYSNVWRHCRDLRNAKEAESRATDYPGCPRSESAIQGRENTPSPHGLASKWSASTITRLLCHSETARAMAVGAATCRYADSAVAVVDL
jgi:hypothetical protein